MNEVTLEELLASIQESLANVKAQAYDTDPSILSVKYELMIAERIRLVESFKEFTKES